MKNDLKDGSWTFYFDNEQLKSNGLYLNDKEEGEWKYYKSNGDFDRKVFYKNGVEQK